MPQAPRSRQADLIRRAAQTYAAAVYQHLKDEKVLNFAMRFHHTLTDDAQWQRDKAIAARRVQKSLRVQHECYRILHDLVNPGTRPTHGDQASNHPETC